MDKMTDIVFCLLSFKIMSTKLLWKYKWHTGWKCLWKSWGSSISHSGHTIQGSMRILCIPYYEYYVVCKRHILYILRLQSSRNILGVSPEYVFSPQVTLHKLSWDKLSLPTSPASDSHVRRKVQTKVACCLWSKGRERAQRVCWRDETKLPQMGRGNLEE